MSDVPPTSPEPTPSDSPTPPPTVPTTPDPSPAPASPDTPKEPTSLLSSAAEPEGFDAEKLTLPEGFDKTEANTLFHGFVKEAKELGLTQPQAQRLVDFHNSEVKRASEASQQSWTTTQEGWVAEVKADKEIGNLAQTKAIIGKVMGNREFTDPGFEEALALTGAGNNPAVIRTLFRWAKMLGEGGPITGTPPARAPNGTSTSRTPAEIMYPGGPVTGGPNLGRTN
jgi:hypothetical protein